MHEILAQHPSFFGGFEPTCLTDLPAGWAKANCHYGGILKAARISVSASSKSQLLALPNASVAEAGRKKGIHGCPTCTVDLEVIRIQGVEPLNFDSGARRKPNMKPPGPNNNELQKLCFNAPRWFFTSIHLKHQLTRRAIPIRNNYYPKTNGPTRGKQGRPGSETGSSEASDTDLATPTLVDGVLDPPTTITGVNMVLPVNHITLKRLKHANPPEDARGRPRAMPSLSCMQSSTPTRQKMQVVARFSSFWKDFTAPNAVQPMLGSMHAVTIPNGPTVQNKPPPFPWVLNMTQSGPSYGVGRRSKDETEDGGRPLPIANVRLP
ncbi:hypothetical protein SODALDRAFT_356432 [Sodiomyces alkalinus F11]|uniref:Uncharacterized protein n=1 Tax=Sodiomyces alkalinus (strain CBS 110278 / VKM F-3762 / F11) TaxID=1314773 RepID=A0A3N2Q183_SODAK|nr:hypothetical protein SODALDRAFT_356432 [Sodiomyces alkalinus F11]ROT40448.1 hypothetical protein SODALDRAFT_356432 [Sodiomyces alkalinus F11]